MDNDRPQKQTPDWSRYRPVSIILGVALSVVFGLYRSNVVQGVDCSNNVGAAVVRDFTHTDTLHFLVNMLSFVYVSGIESREGSVKYLAVIGGILLLSALATVGLTTMLKLRCSIGFSGVILGLMAYGLVTSDLKQFWVPLLYLIGVSVLPTSQNVSISGHLIGLGAGSIIGLIDRYALPKS
jgi:membrane associated rhomboid family serine protease